MAKTGAGVEKLIASMPDDQLREVMRMLYMMYSKNDAEVSFSLRRMKSTDLRALVGLLMAEREERLGVSKLDTKRR